MTYMTYNVFSGTLNPTQSINQSDLLLSRVDAAVMDPLALQVSK